MWALIGAHAVFAATYTFGKLGLIYANPLFFITSRLCILGLLFSVYYLIVHWTYLKTLRWSRQDWLLLAQLIFFKVYASYILAFAVLEHVSSVMYALIFGLTPFFTAFFFGITGREQITMRKMIGLSIGFLGFIPTLFVNVVENEGPMYQFSWPEFVLVLAVMSWAYSWIVVDKFRDRNHDITFINGLSLLIGGGTGLIWALVSSAGSGDLLIYDTYGFLVTFAMTVLATGSSYVVNLWFMQWYSPTFLLLMNFLDPLYAALYGYIFLQEYVIWYFFLTIFVIFTGLYIYYQQEIELMD